MFFKMLDALQESEIGKLVGKTLTEVRRDGDSSLTFVATDGMLEMYHSQDCCETVEIEDISGDLDDLIGTPILVAEERVSENPDPVPDGLKPSDDSNTWTFYTLRTIKGTVDIRWHGSSNGYYSETVYAHWQPSTV